MPGSALLTFLSGSLVDIWHNAYSKKIKNARGDPEARRLLQLELEQLGADVCVAFDAFSQSRQKSQRTLLKFCEAIASHQNCTASTVLNDVYAVMFYYFMKLHTTRKQHRKLFMVAHSAAHEMGRQLLDAVKEGCCRELVQFILREYRRDPKSVKGAHGKAIKQRLHDSEAEAAAGAAGATASATQPATTSNEASTTRQTRMAVKRALAGNPQASTSSSGAQDGSTGVSAAAGASEILAIHSSVATAALGLQVATQYSQMFQQMQAMLDSMDPSQECTEPHHLDIAFNNLAHHRQQLQHVDGSMQGLMDAILQQKDAILQQKQNNNKRRRRT